MGLWFVASALGNALAGFIGGKASEENIAYLPNLFYQCMWILLGVIIILLILKKPINKILKLILRRKYEHLQTKSIRA